MVLHGLEAHTLLPPKTLSRLQGLPSCAFDNKLFSTADIIELQLSFSNNIKIGAHMELGPSVVPLEFRRILSNH